MDNLNKRVINIELKNKIFEHDKAWENSKIRKIIIVALIYIFLILYMKISEITNIYLGGIIPCVGFFLSNELLKIIKKIWIKKYRSGDYNEKK